MTRLSGKSELILSTNTSMNLMTVTSQVTKELERRILEANLNQEQFSQNSFQVAKLELALLLSKHSVSFRSENLILEKNYSSTATYTVVQVKKRSQMQQY